MKLPVGKIAAWIGRALLSALVTEAADRLSRPKRAGDRHDRSGSHQERDTDRLDRE